jgi:hypothetical protein
MWLPVLNALAPYTVTLRILHHGWRICLCIFFLIYFLQYWSLNSGPTSWVILLARFCDEFFEIGSHELFPWGWLWATILLISASWVARITGTSICIILIKIFPHWSGSSTRAVILLTLYSLWHLTNVYWIVTCNCMWQIQLTSLILGIVTVAELAKSGIEDLVLSVLPILLTLPIYTYREFCLREM